MTIAVGPHGQIRKVNDSSFIGESELSTFAQSFNSLFDAKHFSRDITKELITHIMRSIMYELYPSDAYQWSIEPHGQLVGRITILQYRRFRREAIHYEVIEDGIKLRTDDTEFDMFHRNPKFTISEETRDKIMSGQRGSRFSLDRKVKHLQEAL